MLLVPVWHWRQREGCPREIEWPVNPRWISVCCRTRIGRMRGGRRPPPSPANMLNCAGYVDQFRRPGTAGSQACCVPCPPRDREGATTVCISRRPGLGQVSLPCRNLFNCGSPKSSESIHCFFFLPLRTRPGPKRCPPRPVITLLSALGIPTLMRPARAGA